MRKYFLLLLIILLILAVLPNVVFGRDFFLFDLEKNKLLAMGNNDTEFIEKMDLEKIPNQFMLTDNPDLYLALYLPKPGKKEPSYNPDSWRPVTEVPEKKTVQAARIMLFNIASGRTEDIVEIPGYHPFRTALSKDKKHFLISYRTAPKINDFAILHYDISQKKAEKYNGNINWVYNLDFATDSNSFFALVLNGESREMLKMSLAPLALKSSLPAGFNPYKVYVLNANRAVILDLGGEKEKPKERPDASQSNNTITMKGSVKLIDTEKDSVINETFFSAPHIYYSWYKEQNTLLINAREMRAQWVGSNLQWDGRTNFIRVTGDGLKNIGTSVCWSYFYSPEKDLLYTLVDHTLEVYDLKKSTLNKIKTGMNWYTEEFTDSGKSYIRTIRYFVKVIDEANLAVVYCLWNGYIKFYDLTTNKQIKTIKGARIKGQFLEYIDEKTVVTTNRNLNRFYVLNRYTKGIAAFNEKFEQVSTFNLENEQPIGLYQIKKPFLQTVLVTEKALYLIDKDELKLVCNFTNKAKEAYLFEEDKRLIFFINDEWYIIDPQTFELKDHFNEFGDPNQKYTKVEKGERRYYFIPTPVDWQE